MLNKIFQLTIMLILIYSPQILYAQTKEDKFSTQLRSIKEKHKMVQEEYARQNNELRKEIKKELRRLGRDEEDKQTRRNILRETRKRRAELQKEYKEKKRALNLEVTELRFSRRKTIRKQLKDKKIKVKKVNFGRSPQRSGSVRFNSYGKK